MNIYILPAILAFIVNAYILINISQHKKVTTAFIALVLIFLMHHTAEVLSFIEFFKDRHLNTILKIYYASTIGALFTILIYSKKISNIKIKHLDLALIAAAVILSSLTLFTDQIIAGNTSLGYVMTAVKGPLYFLFQIFSITLLIGSLLILASGYTNAKSNIAQIQCSYTLLALLPLVIVSITTIALMALGYKINAIITLPIASTAFLFITMRNESKHKLTDIRRFMPFSAERKASQEIMSLYSSYAQDEISYRDCMAKIERLMVMHKYNKSGNNASATAKSMGMPRSSLYSIFNRLKIDVKDQ